MDSVYGKWGINDLERWFQKQGITDPRDVTDIMLVSYWRHLNSKPIELEKQIRSHMDWWTRGELRIVHENRPLSQQLLTASLKTNDGRFFSIGTLPGRVKVVSFINTKYYPAELVLRSLRDLRQKYHADDVSMSVIVFDFKKVSKRKLKTGSGVHDTADDIAE